MRLVFSPGFDGVVTVLKRLRRIFKQRIVFIGGSAGTRWIVNTCAQTKSKERNECEGWTHPSTSESRAIASVRATDCALASGGSKGVLSSGADGAVMTAISSEVRRATALCGCCLKQ